MLKITPLIFALLNNHFHGTGYYDTMRVTWNLRKELIRLLQGSL